MSLDNPDPLPPRPGETVESTVADRGNENILILYEIQGNVEGDAWLSAAESALIEDPDASRNV